MARLNGTIIPPPSPDRPTTRDYLATDTNENMGLLRELWDNTDTRQIPGVLIEQVYLKTGTDENLLQTNDFRHSFAIPTHRGIDSFLVPFYIPGIGYGP